MADRRVVKLEWPVRDAWGVYHAFESLGLTDAGFRDDAKELWRQMEEMGLIEEASHFGRGSDGE